jgi:outer membrane protein assembly factor BamB
MKKIVLVGLAVLFVLTVFAACHTNDALAAASITSRPQAGPPSQSTRISGSGFAANEAVDVYFDTSYVRLNATDESGSFSTAFEIPVSALPGTHWITAVGRRSGKAAQKSFTVRTNWSQFRKEVRHKGFNQTENVINADNVANLDLAWTAPTGSLITSSPAKVNSVAYVGSEDGKLYAFNVSDGSQRWSFTTRDAIKSSPAVANGVVYVGSDDGYLYAVRTSNGERRWRAYTGGRVASSPVAVLDVHDIGCPESSSVHDVVYVGSENNRLFAFDASSGEEIWETSMDGQVLSSPAVANCTVYVGTSNDLGNGLSNGKLYALNALTGQRFWAIPTGGAIVSSPAVHRNVVFVGSKDHNLYAFNATTGAPQWVAATIAAIESSPAVANGIVYVGSDDLFVYAFDELLGVQLWSNVTLGQVVSSPAVANGVVYVGSKDGKLFAFNASTGRKLWAGPTGIGITSSPAVADGTVYVGSQDGALYAFRLGTEISNLLLTSVPRPDPMMLRPDKNLSE